MSIEAPKGTHDVLPREWPAWQRVLDEAERLCAAYGYRRIVTPTFEETELFARSSGEASDIVSKEMYSFEDRGERSLTLRPEGTAQVCRAYIEHGLQREPQPVKTWLVAPMFRYAKPQKGRFREFWQLNVEAIGSEDPALDAELISLQAAWFRKLEIPTTLLLNSIILYGVMALLEGPWKDPKSGYPNSPVIRPDAEYPILAGYSLHLGVLLSLIAAIAVWWVMRRTTLGFSIRAVGENASAAGETMLAKEEAAVSPVITVNCSPLVGSSPFCKPTDSLVLDGLMLLPLLVRFAAPSARICSASVPAPE